MNLKVVVDSFLEEASINYVFTTDTTQMHELMLSHGLHDRNLNQNECGRVLWIYRFLSTFSPFLPFLLSFYHLLISLKSKSLFSISAIHFPQSWTLFY